MDSILAVNKPKARPEIIQAVEPRQGESLKSSRHLMIYQIYSQSTTPQL
ncbi:hypothetical protein [Lyngbya aestuarii]